MNGKHRFWLDKYEFCKIFVLHLQLYMTLCQCKYRTARKPIDDQMADRKMNDEGIVVSVDVTWEFHNSTASLFFYFIYFDLFSSKVSCNFKIFDLSSFSKIYIFMNLVWLGFDQTWLGLKLIQFANIRPVCNQWVVCD